MAVRLTDFKAIEHGILKTGNLQEFENLSAYAKKSTLRVCWQIII